MEFPKQEYWSGLSFSSAGHLSDPGIELVSPAWQEDSLPTELPGKPEDHWDNLKKLPIACERSASGIASQAPGV